MTRAAPEWRSAAELRREGRRLPSIRFWMALCMEGEEEQGIVMMHTSRPKGSSVFCADFQSGGFWMALCA
jgi:hypothetical protein